MPNIFQIVSNLPVPKRWKLAWYRELLQRSYSKDIKVAHKAGDKEKAQTLKMDLGFELEMHQEDEDSYYTNMLIKQARKLRVPIPHKRDGSGEESEYWYVGNYTGGWYLTNIGISTLRQEIRNEINARHESKAKWVIWVTALTGTIGAVTGLLAVLASIKE